MPNMLDYILWRGDLTFEASPFNPVDNIIFSQLAYLPLDDIVPGPEKRRGITVAQAAEYFSAKITDSLSHGQTIFQDDPAFLVAMGQTKRFQNCILHRYVNHIDLAQEEQFAALCIKMKKATFIAFRGTDTNMVGWKEDFNMSFVESVPSQLEAVYYLENAAKRIHGPLLVGGHSKGGNLAIYAAACCHKRFSRRITTIYSNDCPGFHRHFIASDEFRRVKDRIQLFVPHSSVIGMLFDHGKEPVAVRSSDTGIMQHDLYSWEVTPNDLDRVDSISQGSRFVSDTLREWIYGLSYEQRQKFVDALYNILGESQVHSVFDIEENWLQAAGRIIQSLGQTDDETKKLLWETMSALFKAAKNNIGVLMPQREEPSIEEARY